MQLRPKSEKSIFFLLLSTTNKSLFEVILCKHSTVYYFAAQLFYLIVIDVLRTNKLKMNKAIGFIRISY